MKVLVASAFEAGSPLAHAINTVKMAHGFAQNGCSVKLILLQGKETNPEKLQQFYGLAHPLHWTLIRQKIGPLTLEKHWGFACAALPVMAGFRPDFIYSRAYRFPWLTGALGIKTVAEVHAHSGSNDPHLNAMIAAAGKFPSLYLNTISDVLKSFYIERGANSDHVLVHPDSVDLEQFDSAIATPNLKKSGRPIAMYTGHLYDYKGISEILEAALILPNVDFHIVGGLPNDIQRHEKSAYDLNLNNVVFHGLIDPSNIPSFLKAADVLLLPPSAKHPSAAWTSPVKLAEYLASGKPVVSSNIPALKKLLTEKETIFFRSDDGQDLAEKIQFLLNNPLKIADLTKNGRMKAEEWTYKSRAASLLNLTGTKHR